MDLYFILQEVGEKLGTFGRALLVLDPPLLLSSSSFSFASFSFSFSFSSLSLLSLIHRLPSLDTPTPSRSAPKVQKRTSSPKAPSPRGVFARDSLADPVGGDPHVAGTFWVPLGQPNRSYIFA